MFTCDSRDCDWNDPLRRGEERDFGPITLGQLVAVIDVAVIPPGHDANSVDDHWSKRRMDSTGRSHEEQI